VFKLLSETNGALKKSMSRTKNPTATSVNPDSRIVKLREATSPEQKEILNTIWQYYLRHDQWPVARVLHSQKGKSVIRGYLRPLTGNVVSEVQDYQLGNRYQLSTLGVLLTDSGPANFKLLLRYINYLRALYKSAPEKMSVSSEEIQSAFSLSQEETKLIGELIKLSNLNSGGSYSVVSWTFTVPHEIEDFSDESRLEDQVEDLLFRDFKKSRPVFLDERAVELRGVPPFATTVQTQPVAQQPNSFPIDALKRRYQVFISSTYEDLKEERQQVIQALLETKCIPLGMELFPAASIEQWELIKRVIDECDYYIVVLAGRYGSKSDNGIGFTEMEYDYATEIGKPVIGFCHKSPETLPGIKLDKDDKGRQQFKLFAEKVKKKLCRFWTSSADLGSAVKSAILHELEYNPKPGWVRADVVPNSQMVDKLKQRVADLEEKIKIAKSKSSQHPEGADACMLEFRVDYAFKQRRLAQEYPEKSFLHQIETTWDSVLLILDSDLQAGNTIEWLIRPIKSEFRDKVEEAIKLKLTEDERYEIHLQGLTKIMDTFVARKLVKQTNGGWHESVYRFTPKGLQYRSELRAVKNHLVD
jgi:hypothetical protein